jgi:hypothetical protein
MKYSADLDCSVWFCILQDDTESPKRGRACVIQSMETAAKEVCEQSFTKRYKKGLNPWPASLCCCFDHTRSLISRCPVKATCILDSKSIYRGCGWGILKNKRNYHCQNQPVRSQRNGKWVSPINRKGWNVQALWPLHRKSSILLESLKSLLQYRDFDWQQPRAPWVVLRLHHVYWEISLWLCSTLGTSWK